MSFRSVSKTNDEMLLNNTFPPLQVSSVLPVGQDCQTKNKLDDECNNLSIMSQNTDGISKTQRTSTEYDNLASSQVSNLMKSMKLASVCSTGSTNGAIRRQSTCGSSHLPEKDAKDEYVLIQRENEPHEKESAFLSTNRPSSHLRRCSGGNCSRASTSTSFDDDSLTGSVGGHLDSVTLLKFLGGNPSESEMARIAFTRAQESINDCFSIDGTDILDRTKFDEIPSCTKDELIIGKHLGKGSFSDVFEVTVNALTKAGAQDELHAVLAKADQKIGHQDEGKNSNGLSVSNHSSNEKRRRPQRRNSMMSSFCIGSIGRTTARHGERVTLAMKCLRPQARSNFEHFLIGVEDLVRETAILSSLDHPNIIRLHGRAGTGPSFKLNDGYFILLDRLQGTLRDKIAWWRKTHPKSNKKAPSLDQIKVAFALSDALFYLHDNGVVFRDLKPANVGFDASGTLKLFDFGFAANIPSPPKISSEGTSGEISHERHLLHDYCGTLRYMAPEVGLHLGYGQEVDVYSFGIVLWEVCALRKPFSSIKSVADFENKVFLKGDRPKVDKYWPDYLKDALRTCWSSDSTERPSMKQMHSMLRVALHKLESDSARADRVSSSGKKCLVITKRLSLSL